MCRCCLEGRQREDKARCKGEGVRVTASGVTVAMVTDERTKTPHDKLSVHVMMGFSPPSQHFRLLWSIALLIGVMVPARQSVIMSPHEPPLRFQVFLNFVCRSQTLPAPSDIPRKRAQRQQLHVNCSTTGMLFGTSGFAAAG